MNTRGLELYKTSLVDRLTFVSHADKFLEIFPFELYSRYPRGQIKVTVEIA